MKKASYFSAVLCFALVACSSKEEAVKGKFDIKGNIVKINDKDNRILVEDGNKGLIWVTLTRKWKHQKL